MADCDISDIDPQAILEYRRSRREGNADAPELLYDDNDLLHCLNCVTRHEGNLRPTIAGLILFGSHAALRRQFPMMRIDYIRVNGKEWVPNPDSRFESVEILGPLLLAIPRAISAILDDIPRGFRLCADDDQRTDVPLVPHMAIREAVVNAVMHRSYRLKSPIQVIRYSNRVEFRNPGHSLVPDDRLGEPGSILRNDKIAGVLHETRYAETKGSGIRAMREAMAVANLSPPFFESDRERDSFVATFLFHSFLSPTDAEWLGHFSDLGLSTEERKALVFAREMGAINNLAYRTINQVDTLTASGHLRRIRDLGLTEQKGKSTKTHYVPTSLLLNPQSHGLATRVQPVSNESETEPDAESLREARQVLLDEIPPDVRSAVESLRGRSPSVARTKEVIVQVCTVRPYSARQIAAILGRDRIYIRARLLGPMVDEGLLAYTNPENPSHPHTQYTVPPNRTPSGATP